MPKTSGQTQSTIQIIYKLCYFDEGIFIPILQLLTMPTIILFYHSLARTNTYFYSFVPHSISFWNNLDPSFVCSSSVSAFKAMLCSISLFYNCTFSYSCPCTLFVVCYFLCPIFDGPCFVLAYVLSTCVHVFIDKVL